jgi:predicted ATPase/class 3 adenylate cyclase
MLNADANGPGVSAHPPSTSHDATIIPSGTVTFVFTDIEGSTVRWDRDRTAMQDAVQRHDAIMRAAIAAHAGHVFKTIGDAFCAAFARPEDAVGAMLDAQRALRAADFAAVDGIRVRMAIHTGTADERDGDYFGPAVNRVARLLAIAHGGQVLLSGVTSDLVQGSLPAQASLRDLGEHRLKDLARPEYVYQLLAPDLAAEFPPLRSLDTLANNLPLQVTSFVGRETEIAEITALLEQHRLVTLVGSGGIGKTRTSLQVAANLVDGNGDGVWFVELAPLSSGDYVPATIAQAAGVTLADGDPIARLTAALKSKRMLLVFDNCEHLVEAAARVVSALITTCPQITILASSRQGLGISGEATYRLPSLSAPHAPNEGTDTNGALTADEAQQFTAVALFVERAQAANNRFQLTDSDAPIVADICRRLDGIALAIELAAARVKMLSPQQLRDRLDERFRVITGGGRDRLPRQQTLRALIDWSYDLLDEREQMLFRRLGIFVNGFMLEAAVAVGGGDDLDEFEVFDLVASLAEKSLVMAEPQGSAIRYSLLESTRAYAAEKLAEAGERDRIAGRHLRYFRDWFVQVKRDADEFRVDRNKAFLTEQDDIRFALDGALARSELTDGAELLAAVGITWMAGGFGEHGIAYLQACIAALPSSASLLLAQLGTALADLCGVYGRFRLAAMAANKAVRSARAAGNGPILAAALKADASVWIVNGDIAAADAALTEAEAIADVSPILATNLLMWRARLSMSTGDLDTAARSFARLRDQFRSLGSRRNEALCISDLATVEFYREQYLQAADLWREAIAMIRGENQIDQLCVWLLCMGSTLALGGDLQAATLAAIESWVIGARHGPEHAAPAIELRAYICALQGDLERSARLAGYGATCFPRVEIVRDKVPTMIYNRLTALMEDHLAPDILARLTAEGAALTPEAAMALARE